MVGVNLSLRQFQNPGLVEHVARLLRETGLDPALLTLEITESVAMHDVDSTVRALERLNAMGVWLVIDDFGTGNSSIAHVGSRFKMNHLKLDGAFVREFLDDPENPTILPGLIDFAHAVGLRVIAEGVETREQLERLRELGCEFVQGYYVAPPLGAAEATDLLAGRKPLFRGDPPPGKDTPKRQGKKDAQDRAYR
jgi:EAL domain-containing protein (putative c-di-GMP-specific phosphodiesterase class I)